MKKILAIMTLIIVAINVFPSAQASLKGISENSIKERFQLKSILEIEIEKTKGGEVFIINPSSPEIINLSIRYKIDTLPIGLKLKMFINKFISNPNLQKEPSISISLSLEGLPSYCTAEFEPKNFKFNISDSLQEGEVQLKISVDNQAPALEKNNIIIKATAKPYDSFVIPKIQESTAEAKITVSPYYLGIIDLKNHNWFSFIKPGENAVTNLTVINKGNSETSVDIEVENPPEFWTISIDPSNIPSLAIGEEKKIKIIATPKAANESKEEQVKIKFTPKSTYSDGDIDDSYLTGTPKYFTLKLDSVALSKVKSTPGFELIFAIFAIAIVLFLVSKKTK